MERLDRDRQLLLDRRADPDGTEPSASNPFAAGLSQHNDQDASSPEECLKKFQEEMSMYISGLSGVSTRAPSTAPSEVTFDDAGSEATLTTSEATEDTSLEMKTLAHAQLRLAKQEEGARSDLSEDDFEGD